jgi:hypothetical protein
LSGTALLIGAEVEAAALCAGFDFGDKDLYILLMKYFPKLRKLTGIKAQYKNVIRVERK